MLVYSRASDNGPSEKRTASLQRTTVASVIMIHTFIPEVKLSDVLFDNH